MVKAFLSGVGEEDFVDGDEVVLDSALETVVDALVAVGQAVGGVALDGGSFWCSLDAGVAGRCGWGDDGWVAGDGGDVNELAGG